MTTGISPTTAAFVSILISLASRIGFSPVIDLVREYRDAVPELTEQGPKMTSDDAGEQIAFCNVAIGLLQQAEQKILKGSN